MIGEHKTQHCLILKINVVWKKKFYNLPISVNIYNTTIL